MKIVKASKANMRSKRRVFAAEEDFGDYDDFALDNADNPEDGLSDQLDTMQDQIEDIQDSIDDDKEDAVDIDVENNISGHYIAECESCKGIFISGVIKSDQEIDSVSGVCPVCGNETEQLLKWIVVPVDEA